MSDSAGFLSPVTGGRASQQIVEQIIALLRAGQLGPGDRLPPERQLAEDFGVSRVTVRDALRVLEAQGLMTVKVGASGGAFVTAPSEAMLGERLNDLLTLSTVTPEEVAEARLVMELGIVSLAVDRATEQDIDELQQMCEVAEEAVRHNRYDPQMSNDFHGRLAVAAHNSAVTKIARSFRGPLRMAALRARERTEGTYQRYQLTVDDHKKLLAALAARDADQARDVMRRHLTRGTSLHVPHVGPAVEEGAAVRPARPQGAVDPMDPMDPKAPTGTTRTRKDSGTPASSARARSGKPRNARAASSKRPDGRSSGG